MQRLVSLVAVAALVVATSRSARAAEPPAPPLAITVDAVQVVVTGVTPKQRAALFVVAQLVEGFGITTSRRTEVLEDTDGDGTVSFKPSGGVPVRSVWFAIDLAKGTSVEGQSAEFLAGERALPAGAPSAEHSSLPFVVGEVLVARSNVGVWDAHIVDGHGGDKDGKSDGVVDLALDSLRTSGSGPARPSQLQAGDTIVAVDPLTLEYVVTQVR